MGNRLNELAADVPTQMAQLQHILQQQQLQQQQQQEQFDNMHTLLLSVTTQLGITNDPTTSHAATSSKERSRTLQRCGTGSNPTEPNAPRLDTDGIPQLPTGFTFDGA